MTTEDFITRCNLRCEQTDAYLENCRCVDSWLDLIDNLKAEHKKKLEWATEQLNAAKRKRDIENNVFERRIKKINEKYEEETT